MAAGFRTVLDRGNRPSAVTTVAMPLIAVTVLHASAFVVGVLQAAMWLPWLVIGLPAGAWVDRLPRRQVMVVCDVASMLSLASVPIAAWCGVLTITQVLVVALLSGVASVFFLTSQQVFIPETVSRREDLPEANAKVEGSEAAARIAGPGVGGLLAQMFSAATVLLIDALGCAVSAVCLLAVRAEDPCPTEEKRSVSLIREIREGLAYAVADPYLRPMTAYSAVSNLTFGALQAILMVFLVRAVGVDAATVGGLIGITGVGGLLGALVAGRIARKLGTGRAVLLSESCTVPSALLIPLTARGAGLVLFVLGMLVMDFGLTVSNVVLGSFKQSYVPRSLLGRITASSRWVSYGAVAVGALLGGILATSLGVRAGVWFTTVAEVLCVGILYVGPIRQHRDLPGTREVLAVSS